MATASDGTPARWNPCAPIHYLFNPAGAPSWALVVIRQSLAMLHDAAGFDFVYDGTSDSVPNSSWGMQRDSRYPSGSPPLLIGWARPGQSDLLDGKVVAASHPVWWTLPAGKVITTGSIAVDIDVSARLTTGFGGRSIGAAMLHELSHALGLNHVGDQQQIMYPQVTDKPTRFGAGDLNGLHRLREGGCLPNPPTPG
jgi:hypothetical protein